MIGELGVLGAIGMMKNDGQQKNPGHVGSNNHRNGGGGFFPNSRKAISSYWRIVSSGASTVASSVKSAGFSVASSLVDREDEATGDSVIWAAFDKLECENISRQVLLLAFRNGFQVWDVEDAHNVREMVCKQDGPVAFLQMQPDPVTTKKSDDKFLSDRPLLIVVGNESANAVDIPQGSFGSYSNGSTAHSQDPGNVNFVPTVVRFYSMRSHYYAHALKFRSVVYSVRCSSRVVAIALSAQIHCFDAASLESVYIVCTYPVVSGSQGSGFGVSGYGPLAVGTRWLAHTGNPVVVSTTGRVSPTAPASLSSSPNGSLVAHYAKESTKTIAAGIVTIGDISYKTISKYCNELLPESNYSPRLGNGNLKTNGAFNGQSSETEYAGMVIIRDIVRKCVIAQFRAHRSPISALCFDPSGTLLVTASVQGHNINVFRIMPANIDGSSESETATSYIHLYRLQRGLTNAVIQDISFSHDSRWIMISSSRGTSHLFAISPFGGNVNLHSAEDSVTKGKNGFAPANRSTSHLETSSSPPKLTPQTLFAPGPPVTLSVIGRIRNGTNGWKGAVTGAAAAATGRMNLFTGAIGSTFRNCNKDGMRENSCARKSKYHLLLFSPSGSIIEYALRLSSGTDPGTNVSGFSSAPYETAEDPDNPSLLVETVQKWDLCKSRNRVEREENLEDFLEHKNGVINRSARRYANGTSYIHSSEASAQQSKMNVEENHHMYISKAELQMHQHHVPLWAKPEIHFQVMVIDGIKTENGGLGGEIEIERVPSRSVEARSKDLVPIVDYVQTSALQHLRMPVLESYTNEMLLHQKSGNFSDGKLSRRGSSNSLESVLHQKSGNFSDGKLSRRGSSNSLDSVPEPVANGHPQVLTSHIDENGWGDLLSSTDLMGGFAKNSESPHLEISLGNEGNTSE